MWSNFLAVIFVLFFSSGMELNTPIDPGQKRVLIVPFDQMGFQSTIDLPIIISANHFNSIEEISVSYQNEITQTLSKKGQSFLFFGLPANEIRMLKAQAPIIYKKKPTSHYGIDLSKLHQKDMIKTLLSNFSADYILFLCRYTVDNKLFSSAKSFEGSTFVNWSIHGIDYEVYNSDQDLIALASRFGLVPKRPTDTTYLTYGVRVDGMKNAYTDLREDIEKKIDNYTGKPVYRLKD